MTNGTIAFVSLAASVAIHAAAFASYYLLSDNAEPLPQGRVESKVSLETFVAPQEDALERETASEAAASQSTSGTSLADGAIRQTKATAIAPNAETAKVAVAAGVQTELAEANIQEAPAISTADESVQSLALAADTALRASDVNVGTTLKSDKIATAPAAAADINDVATVALIVETPSVSTIPNAIDAAPLAALAPTTTQTPQVANAAIDALSVTPTVSTSKATTAWAFSDRLVTDPVAVQTIQAFMEPQSFDGAQSVKDDLSSALHGLECARVTATFLPETGALELRGHIPDMALRDAILANFQSEVGEGLPVQANLLHLPKPQCNILGGIADVGLAQSTDQFTNPLLIGPTAHAQEYNYSEGQRLQFDLTAPDYDAYVYVDYFAADGKVIHLVPNQYVPIQLQNAKSLFGVGKSDLELTIGPPYGREIAVAFASSVELFEELRPIIEPASQYLAAMKEAVDLARQETPEFKGEWVYFFITTAPATQ